jgi:hypothetical protein
MKKKLHSIAIYVLFLFAVYYIFGGPGFRSYRGPIYDKRVMDDFAKLGKNVAKEYQFRYLNQGFGDMISGDETDETTWGIAWTCDKAITLEEGRVLAAKVATTIFDAFQASKACQDYHKERLAELKSHENSGHTVHPSHIARHSVSLSVDDLSFKIAFWDENVQRRGAPYLSQIVCIHGIFYYQFADFETQKLRKPEFTEPFCYTWGNISPK